MTKSIGLVGMVVIGGVVYGACMLGDMVFQDNLRPIVYEKFPFLRHLFRKPETVKAGIVDIHGTVIA